MKLTINKAHLLLFLIFTLVINSYSAKSELVELQRYWIFLDSSLSSEIKSKLYFSYGEIEVSFDEKNREKSNLEKMILSDSKKEIIKRIDNTISTKYYFDSLHIKVEQIPRIIYFSYFERNKFDTLIRTYDLLDSLQHANWINDSTLANYVNMDTINRIYIPRNIDECLSESKKLLKKEDLDRLKSYLSENEINEHFRIGWQIRNLFALWYPTRLHNYFKALRIDNADIMSSLILVLLYRDLNNIPIDYQLLINKFRWYNSKTKY